MDEIMSISTGVVGDDKINCHLAQEIGTIGVSKIIGENFDSVKFKRKEKVLPLATVSNSIKVNQDIIPINPLMLFQRICVTKQSDGELKEHLKYELTPFPLSLFTEEGMRKGTKSSLYSAFSPLPNDTELGANCIEIVDGGYLLHRLLWHRNATYGSICRNYVDYVKQHHGENVLLVFDGYPVDATEKSTKSAERLRRSRKERSADIIFDEAICATVSQQKILANESNKIRLISMLKRIFEQSNFLVKQATEDADTLIICTAIEMSSEYDSVIVVGEDIDLLVLLTALATSHPNIYFRKPGIGKITEKLYSTHSFKHGEASAENILFLHAFSGCDTTSVIFNIGKIKFITTLDKNPFLRSTVKLFKETDVNPAIIETAGESFLVALYGGSKNDTLDSLRYLRFAKSVTKSKCNLASLPPTKEAARYHSFRTYHQVQAWYNVQTNPLEWGWQRNKHGLTPVTIRKDPAPQSLLKLISCKCKTTCGGCRKMGLKCSIICGTCNG